MQKLSIVLGLAFAGCGSCSEAEKPSSAKADKPAAGAPAAPAVKPALPDVVKPDPANRERFAERMKQREHELDTNGDGVVSDEERDAAFARRAQTLHTRLDKDGDGKVTQAELDAAGRIAHRLGDPAKVDANHDGVITVEEIEAALHHRFDEWKTNSGSGSGQ